MNTMKLTQRSKMFNTMLRMYGKGQSMTRKEALIAVLITNGIINTPEEYDWREHRGYYSVAFSAYGCNHFYHPIKGTKTYQEDHRYLVKETDEKGKTRYTIKGGWYILEEYRSVSVPQAKKISINTNASFALGIADSPVTEVPLTRNTDGQTQLEKNQYIASLLNMYKDAVNNGDMKMADFINSEIKSQF